VDSQQLFDRALEHSIAITPGLIYSPVKRFRNYVRLSYGHPWNERLEEGIARLGVLATELADTA